MRKVILIAAMVLTSAAAQAGDWRSLSTGATNSAPSDPPAAVNTQRRAQNDAPAATTPKQTESPRYTPPSAETQAPSEPARNVSDAPRYTTRPAAVDTTTPTTASTAPSTATPSAARPERRYDDRGYYDDNGYHPTPRRHATADRATERPHAYAGRPHYRPRWTVRRIVATLHRYGIYW